MREGEVMTRVLIVEDEEVVLILAQSVLEEHGYQTQTAGDLAGASALLESEDAPDCLFTDINLGGESGLDLAARAREILPSILVLYTTGAAITDGMRARMVEGSDILPKPYRVEDMVEALARLLERGPALST
jgi:CheY-like chemotaxis protein